MRRATEKTRQVAIRFPVNIINRLEQHVERLRAKHPGYTFTTSDAIRMLVHSGLEEFENVDDWKKWVR